MRTMLVASALALTLTLAACGDDDSSSDTTAGATTVAPATTQPATTAAPAPPTGPAAASSTAPPSTTTPTSVAATAAATTADIGAITVDADNDRLRTVTLPLGTAVTLVVRSATPQEFHLHGYDLEQSGTEVVFRFTADLPGTFELESHDTEQPILVLDVA